MTDQRLTGEHIRQVGMIVARLFRCFPAYPNETQIAESMKVYTEILSQYSIRALEMTADDFARGKVPGWKLGNRPTTDVLAQRAGQYDEQMKRCKATPAAQISLYVARYHETGVWPDAYGPPPGHSHHFAEPQAPAGEIQHTTNPAISR